MVYGRFRHIYVSLYLSISPTVSISESRFCSQMKFHCFFAKHCFHRWLINGGRIQLIHIHIHRSNNSFGCATLKTIFTLLNLSSSRSVFARQGFNTHTHLLFSVREMKSCMKSLLWCYLIKDSFYDCWSYQMNTQVISSRIMRWKRK